MDNSFDRASPSVFCRCRIRPISRYFTECRRNFEDECKEKEAADHELSRCMGRVCMYEYSGP